MPGHNDGLIEFCQNDYFLVFSIYTTLLDRNQALDNWWRSINLYIATEAREPKKKVPGSVRSAIKTGFVVL